jgi:hypothetical protein
MSSKKVVLKSIASELPAHIDLFICAAGFEERSKVISLQLAPASIGRVLLCADKRMHFATADKNRDAIAEHFGPMTQILEIKIDDPLATADALLLAIRSGPPVHNATVVIDLTTFSHEVLLILLKVVQAALSTVDTVIGVYNGAAEYSLGSDSANKWLTKGVKDVRSVLGYSGLNIPSQKSHLIILAGFETERAEKLVEFYEPTVLSIGHGDPLASIANSHFDLNRQFHRKLMDKYRDVQTFTFSCADPSETQRAIEEQIAKFPAFNVILAPLNTKISTAGVAMAAMRNPAIQLCYASVTTYNERAYSSPSEDCYVFKLVLIKSPDSA